MKIGHILIATPEKTEAAVQRMSVMGITPHLMRAVVPNRVSPKMSQVNYDTFSGQCRPRTAKEHGIALAHIAALNAARTHEWEWAGIWEDDVDGEKNLRLQELKLPSDCGVVYLGGALWWPKEAYGKRLNDHLWQVTEPLPISGAHALLIHRRAMEDIMSAYCEMSMTLDDLLSGACIFANEHARWATCFASPWLAWQTTRPETWNTDGSAH